MLTLINNNNHVNESELLNLIRKFGTYLLYYDIHVLEKRLSACVAFS